MWSWSQDPRLPAQARPLMTRDGLLPPLRAPECSQPANMAARRTRQAEEVGGSPHSAGRDESSEPRSRRWASPPAHSGLGKALPVQGPHKIVQGGPNRLESKMQKMRNTRLGSQGRRCVATGAALSPQGSVRGCLQTPSSNPRAPRETWGQTSAPSSCVSLGSSRPAFSGPQLVIH